VHKSRSTKNKTQKIIIPETSPDPVFKSFVPLCFALFDQVEPTTPPEDARKAGVIDAVGQYLAASHDEFPWISQIHMDYQSICNPNMSNYMQVLSLHTRCRNAESWFKKILLRALFRMRCSEWF
jgi:hypothetical protein